MSGIRAPAIAATLALQTPPQTTSISVRMSPLVVRIPATRPSATSTPMTSVDAETVRAPSAAARSRMSVPP